MRLIDYKRYTAETARRLGLVRRPPSRRAVRQPHGAPLPALRAPDAGARRGRPPAWRYAFVYPNTAIDLYPDQVNVWQIRPAGTALTRDVWACFRHEKSGLMARMVQRINNKLNSEVLDEDIDLVRAGPDRRRHDRVQARVRSRPARLPSAGSPTTSALIWESTLERRTRRAGEAGRVRRQRRGRPHPRGGLRADRHRRNRRRADRARRHARRRVERAGPPLLRHPRGAARRRRSCTRSSSPRRSASARTEHRRRAGHGDPRPRDPHVAPGARGARARVGAVGGALAARGSRRRSPAGGGGALRALPLLARRRRSARASRAASSQRSTRRRPRTTRWRLLDGFGLRALLRDPQMDLATARRTIAEILAPAARGGSSARRLTCDRFSERRFSFRPRLGQGGRARAMSPRPQVDHIRKPQILTAAGEVIAQQGRRGDCVSPTSPRPPAPAPPPSSTGSSRATSCSPPRSPSAEDSFYEELGARLARARGPARQARCSDRLRGGRRGLGAVDGAVDRSLRDPDLAAARQRLDDRWRSEIPRSSWRASPPATSRSVDTERATLELAALIDGLAVQMALRDRAVSSEVHAHHLHRCRRARPRGRARFRR